MGKIVVKVAGREVFEWSGERREIRDLERRVAKAAKSVQKTSDELCQLTLQSVLAGPGLSADQTVRDMQIGGIAHYLLGMPTGRAGKPGSHGDYVATGTDLVFDLQRGGPGELRIEVTGPADF